jgi:hypothetical protein
MVKSSKSKIEAPKVDTPDSEEAILKAVGKKRDGLIQEIRGNLLTKRQLKQGGSDVRARHLTEQANYNPVLGEINDLGKRLSLAPIGLGHIRKE